MQTPSPSDEQPHAVGGAVRWSENYAFHLHDPGEGIGGFGRIGVRPNEGSMDVELSFFLPDGGFVTARHVKPQASNTADLEVEDARFEMLEPLRRWRLSYDGPAHALRDARDAGKAEAWRKSRLERLSVELEFEASHPGARAASRSMDGFEQAGRWTGAVWVSGDEYRIASPGSREKSWGVDDRQSLRAARRVAIAFADGDAVFARRVEDADGDFHDGWILGDGRATALRKVEVAIEPDATPALPERVRLSLTDAEGGVHAIEGEVLHAAPLPRSSGGRTTTVRQGIARVSSDGRTGYGVVELED